MSGSVSHEQTFGTTPTACIRFAVLSQIEILHILLEHFYDSQRNENAGSAHRLHRRQPVAKARICSVRSDRSSGGLPSRLGRADATYLQTVTARLPGEVDRGLTPKTAAMMNYPV
jgi:hypothetical protein